MTHESKTACRARNTVVLLAKLGLSTGLLFWLASKFRFDFTWPQLQSNGIALLLVCIAIGVLQICILSFRWQITTKTLAGTDVERLTAGVTFPTYLKLTWLGQAVSQVLPAVIAGDGLRIAGLKLAGLPLLFATQSVFVDRIIGFLGLALLVVPGVIVAGKTADFLFLQTLMLTVVGGVFCSVLLLKSGLVSKTLNSLQRFEVLAASLLRPIGGLLLAQAVAGHALSVVIFWLLCLSFGLNISLTLCFLTVPLALMLAILPFSFGGWGVRELAVIHALGAFGVSSAFALQASLIFGMSQLLVSLPSAFLLIGAGASNRMGRNHYL